MLRLQFSLFAVTRTPSASAEAIDSSISLMAGSLVELVLPETAALDIVYRPFTSPVQKSLTWFQSRSFARKSASADVRGFREVEALRSLDARWLDRRPGMAMAAMMAMIAITIISSISVKPMVTRP